MAHLHTLKQMAYIFLLAKQLHATTFSPLLYCTPSFTLHYCCFSNKFLHTFIIIIILGDVLCDTLQMFG